MKILVTDGFIGSHVTEYYANRRDRVIVFDNLSKGEILGKSMWDPLYNFNYLKESYDNIELVTGNVSNFGEIKEALAGVDVIIHTTAQVA